MIRTNDMIITGVGIGLGILALYWIQHKKNPKPVAKVLEKAQSSEKIKHTKPSTTVTTQTPYTDPKKEIKKPWLLSKGSKEKEVERLQIWLLRNHGWKGTITKVFDEQTEKLVKKIFKRDSIDKRIYDKYKMGTPIHELTKA